MSDRCPKCRYWQCQCHLPPVVRVLNPAGGRSATPSSGEWFNNAIQVATHRLPANGRTFIGEDIRYTVLSALPPPHTEKVWGALTQQLAARGIIKRTGRHIRPLGIKSHASPTPEYSRS